jgi:hypothetical protein
MVHRWQLSAVVSLREGIQPVKSVQAIPWKRGCAEFFSTRFKSWMKYGFFCPEFSLFFDYSRRMPGCDQVLV